MKIKKNVNVPRMAGNRLGEVSKTILEFVDSDDVNLKFECGGKEEAGRVYSTATGRIKTDKLPCKAMRSGFDIYIVRKEG